MYEVFSRQEGLVSYERLQEVEAVVIGCGGLGSWTALALAKLGVGKITLVDHDRVEAGNVPSQFFTREDVGKNKAEALKVEIEHYAPSDVDVRAVSRPWSSSLLGEVVVCCVDSMETRGAIFEAVKASGGLVKSFHDGRMGGELVRTHHVALDKPEQVIAYENSLYTSEEAEPLRCGSRAIVYACMVASGLLAHGVKEYAAGRPVVSEVIMDLAARGAVWSR